jgi:hypothetical protein
MSRYVSEVRERARDNSSDMSLLPDEYKLQSVAARIGRVAEGLTGRSGWYEEIVDSDAK